jgi:hypothetical protein
MPAAVRSVLGHWPARGLVLALAFLSYALYGFDIADNPPGFYQDESAMAYNAYLIGRTGHDLNGEFLPVYTTFFGGAMNMPFIYILAAVFNVTGPSIAVARLTAASLVFTAALVLGALGYRMSGRLWIGGFVAVTAMLTPHIFQIGRFVFEVAIYPLAVGLLLLSVWRAHERRRIGWFDAAAIAGALALVTYGYSIGRLLGPLLALGVLLFLPRLHWRDVARTWAVYAALLVPLLVFQLTHPGWLTERFDALTYVGDASPLDAAVRFASHYVRNVNPLRLLFIGDHNLRLHVPGMGGVILLATLELALLGLVRTRVGPFSRYVFYAKAM